MSLVRGSGNLVFFFVLSYDITTLLLLILVEKLVKGRNSVISSRAIQCLRGQEEVGRWFQKYSFLTKFRVKIVHVEVGRWSKKDHILST